MEKERNFENVITIIQKRAKSYGQLATREWAENGATPLWRRSRSTEMEMKFILDLFNDERIFQECAEIWLPDE